MRELSLRHKRREDKSEKDRRAQRTLLAYGIDVPRDETN